VTSSQLFWVRKPGLETSFQLVRLCGLRPYRITRCADKAIRVSWGHLEPPFWGSAQQSCVYEDLFLPSQRCLTPSSWGTPCDISAVYTSLKGHLGGYNSVIRLAVITYTKHEWINDMFSADFYGVWLCS